MPDMPDLDTRIRDLVHRAVADAPAPPDLDRVPEHRNDRRLWWIGGGVALATAAAAVAVFTFASTDDNNIETVPATEPAIVPTPAPTVPPTPPDATAPVTAVPPVTEKPAASAAGGAVVTAGPNGVVVYRDGRGSTVTPQAITFAIAIGDGRFVGQLFAGPSFVSDPSYPAEAYGEDGTAPLLISSDGSVGGLFDTADWDGSVTIHDVEVVDGRRLMLYDLATAPDDPERADETLYVVDLATQERTEIAQTGDWESATGRLHLATTGLIVGQWNSGATHRIEVHTVPGSPADVAGAPSAADLGFPAPFDNCAGCPRSFTVTPDGESLAWVDPADDLSSYEIVVRGLDGGEEQRWTLADEVPADLIDDLDISADQVLISFWDGATGERAVPLALPASDPASSPSVLGGELATIGAAAAAEAAPPPSEPTPSTTPVAAANVGAVVTAGADGIVEYREGEPVTISNEPAAFAIAVGDGRVLAQIAQGYARYVPGGPKGEDAAATMPFLVNNDGTTEPLSPGAEADYVTLHDVEVVDGRTLLLYTSADRPPENLADDSGEIAYVVDVDEPATPPTEIAQVSGWEYGTDRLTLATTGLIVGQWNAGPSHGIELHAVPGSPAAIAGVPAPVQLGLPDDGFGECTGDDIDCPHAFSVTPDGLAVGWLQRSEDMSSVVVVTRPLDGEPAVGPPIAIADHVVSIDHDGERSLLTFFSGYGAESETRAPVQVVDGRPTDLSGLAATTGPTAP